MSESMWGHNCRLTANEHRRAILSHVLERAARSGKPVPCDGDMLDLMDRSKIVLLDANGREVTVERVVVAWEDR